MEREKELKRKSVTKRAQRENKKNAHRKKKYFQRYDNQRSLLEDRTGSTHLIIFYDPPKNGDCQFSAISKFLTSIGIHGLTRRHGKRSSITSTTTPLLTMEYHCKISQIYRGPHICLQCLKMVRLATTSRYRLHPICTMSSSKFYHLMDLGSQPQFL